MAQEKSSLKRLETEKSESTGRWVAARIGELSLQGYSVDPSEDNFNPELYLFNRIIDTHNLYPYFCTVQRDRQDRYKDIVIIGPLPFMGSGQNSTAPLTNNRTITSAIPQCDSYVTK